MQKIQVAKPYFPSEDIEKILIKIREVLQSGMLMQGKYVEEFEQEFAKYVGTKYAVAVNSGTAALQGIYEYFNVNNKEVLVPTNTFIATANAVIYAGGNPVLVDIDKEMLAIDLEDLEKKITERTVGITLVHLAGFVSPQIDRIKQICQKYNLFLIEDAAHAHGSTWQGKKAGSLSKAGAFSFVATKVMTSGGEGGIVTTDNEEIVNRIKSLRFHGADVKPGVQDRLGYNWRMIEIQAIIGLSQLERLDEIVMRRMQIAQQYNEAFSQLNKVRIVRLSENEKCAYYKYPLILDSSLDCEYVKNRLLDEFGVKSGGCYWPPCHLQPVYKKIFGYKEGDFPVADDILSRTISLPIYMGLTKEEVERVIKAVQYVCH